MSYRKNNSIRSLTGILEKIFSYCSESIYLPSDDTYLLYEILRENPEIEEGKKALEVGSGSGLLSCVICEKMEFLVAIDITDHAVECSKKILYECGCSDFSDVVQCRSGSCFRDNSFDLIFSNPPYLPDEDDPRWSGGARGIEISLEIMREASRTLKLNKGMLFLVSSSLGALRELLVESLAMGFRPKAVKWIRKFFEVIIVFKFNRGS
ncbi:MAG: methyltransferase [Sulfolobales archaeon]